MAVLDSGIDFWQHPALQGRVIWQAGDLLLDFTDDHNGIDLVGHGTHVAGIIASNDSTYKGVAPGCELINVKVWTITGWYYEWYSAGVQWCIDNKDDYEIGVINLSAGETRVNETGKFPCDGTCGFCKMAENAIEAGIVFVAAAGNEGLHGSQTLKCPAYSFNVITVGACNHLNTNVTSDDILANYSSCGPTKDGRPKPDVLAPGSNSSDGLWGIWSCTSYQERLEFGLWRRKSGTSMATPHVSGTVALMLQVNPNLTPAQVKAALRETARLNNNLSSLTKNEVGYGIIDAYSAAYVSQYTYLIDKNLTFDEYHINSNTTLDGTNRRIQLDVNRTTYGIDLTNIVLNQTGGSLYTLCKSIKTRYVWIDGSMKALSDYNLYLSSGPRVEEKGAGYVIIRATYKINDVTVLIYYYIGVSSVTPWVMMSSPNSHTYRKIIYVDPDLRGSANDYATYSNGTVIQNEIKLSDTEIRVKDYQYTSPNFTFMPYQGSPDIWILKYNAYCYSNPENGKNGENINGTDIVLYYNYTSWVGPWIFVNYS